MPMMPMCSTGRTQVNSPKKLFSQRGARRAHFLHHAQDGGIQPEARLHAHHDQIQAVGKHFEDVALAAADLHAQCDVRQVEAQQRCAEQHAQEFVLVVGIETAEQCHRQQQR